MQGYPTIGRMLSCNEEIFMQNVAKMQVALKKDGCNKNAVAQQCTNTTALSKH